MVTVEYTRSRAGAWALAFTAALLVAVVVSSCYPDYGLTVEDYDAVATYYDGGTDFGAFKKYYLIDTVRHVIPPGSRDDISRDVDPVILTAVDGHLKALGYIPTVRPDSADIAVQTSITKQEYLVYYGWGWWGGWYWPGYYPPVYTYNYSAGTIVLDMADAKASIASRQVKSVWFALLQGLADDAPARAQQRIRNGISQAFEQSPYLGARN